MFRYVLRLEKPPTPALHVGKTVHAVLQAWNLKRWRKQPFDNERLKELFNDHWLALQEGHDIDWEGVENLEKDKAWKLLEIYWLETPIKANEMPEAVEVLVEAEIRGQPKLVGILDLVRSGGRIVDFKTCAQTPNPETAAYQHELQLTCYALLYRHATGHQESGLEIHHLVKLKAPKVIITTLPPITEAQVSRLKKAIDSYVQGLDKLDFVPSTGLHCSYCEFFNECRNWH